jgi:hypothetical protein
VAFRPDASANAPLSGEWTAPFSHGLHFPVMTVANEIGSKKHADFGILDAVILRGEALAICRFS